LTNKSPIGTVRTMTDTDQKCSNPNCVLGAAEKLCEACSRWFCFGHAKHPEHHLPEG